MKEGNLWVPKADECSSKDETIKLFRKITAEQVSDQFYLKSYWNMKWDFLNTKC